MQTGYSVAIAGPCTATKMISLNAEAAARRKHDVDLPNENRDEESDSEMLVEDSQTREEKN